MGDYMKQLQDRIAVVTGGTRGIGFDIVKTFLNAGATVVFCGSRQETVDEALAKFKAINPDYKVSGIWPNLTNYYEVEAAINDVVAEHGRIDILVNNAGISAHESIFEYDPAHFDYIMQLNVNACFYTSRAAAPHMKQQHSGVILYTSSMVTREGQMSGAGYPVSKFALNGLTYSLGRELAQHGIRVNAVAPGVTDTDMVANLPAEVREGIIKAIPLGRMGKSEEMAEAFLYLASDQAAFITGQILFVDGGQRV